MRTIGIYMKCLAVLSVCAVGLMGPIAAQEYPSRTVHLIVPQAAGGATDAFARAIGQKLSERWRQAVVVENRAGAAGVVGTDFVAKSQPDGYTLLVTYEGSQAINQSLYQRLPFDSVKDFTPIATIAVTPFFLIVGPKVQVKTLQEFIDLARQKPDTFNYASAGNGSVNHLLGEMLKSETGVRIVHVPYKGASQAITDVIGGHVDAAFTSVPSVISNVLSGNVRALAVSSAKRIAIAPDVPTISESGVPNFDVNPWWGLLAPAGLSPDIIAKINADMAEVLRTPEMHELFAKFGASPLASSPDEFSKRLQSDIGKWARAVRAAGVRIN